MDHIALFRLDFLRNTTPRRQIINGGVARVLQKVSKRYYITVSTRVLINRTHIILHNSYLNFECFSIIILLCLSDQFVEHSVPYRPHLYNTFKRTLIDTIQR